MCVLMCVRECICVCEYASLRVTHVYKHDVCVCLFRYVFMHVGVGCVFGVCVCCLCVDVWFEKNVCCVLC